MFLWMIASLWLWGSIWTKFGNTKYFWSALFISAAIQLWFFFADLAMWLFGGVFDLGTNRVIQSFFGGDHDIFRPGGLASEPSLYASWVLFVWPLLLLRGTTHRRSLFILITILLIASGVASTSRTFVVILAIQLPLITFSIYRNPSPLKVIIGIVLFPLAISSVLAFGHSHFTKISSLFNESQSMSTLARRSGQIASRAVSQDFPLSGIGLGQFTAYYPAAVPFKYFASHEVQKWASGHSESRVSTFNTLWRIQVEFGGIIATIFLIIALLLIIRWTLVNDISVQQTYLLGSLIGGTSFLLQQDQFGYQPGIFAGAIFICGILQKKADPK